MLETVSFVSWRLVFALVLCVSQESSSVDVVVSVVTSLSPRRNQACCPVGGGVHARMILTMRILQLCGNFVAKSFAYLRFFRAPGMYFFGLVGEAFDDFDRIFSRSAFL